ncbi:sugar ABC transporter substrate-binding protein [Bacillus marinisedimentorum]|uniref:sugar ABC transporter substrate-binding protein n=1 Tax=Bacillus marinisedimentorum TaxID=1821260 RepID=UPI000872B0CE|nr:substrate-binding domain-containing protein [Bacillus marinisedimentorum]
MRKAYAIILVVFIIAALASIGFLKEAREREVKIGYHVVSLKHPYAERLAEEFEDEAVKRGFVPLIVSGKNDRLQEQKNIDFLIEQKVDAIFITALDGDFIVSAVKRANEAGIPVFAIDRKINGGKLTSTITSDNEDIGEQAAHYIVDRLTRRFGKPAGNVAEVKGLPDVSATIERSQGFHKVLSRYPGINISAEVYGDYDPIVSRNAALKIIEEQTEIDAIFAHNDDILKGVYSAFEEMKPGYRTIMVGVDGNPDILKLIKTTGKVDATLVQQANKIMTAALNAFEDHRNGKEVPEQLNIKASLYK